MNMEHRTKHAGFTALFAVIVSALVLAIGISIANITLKQIQISSANRDSQIAFYAADSGAECALFADLNEKAFPLEGGPLQFSCLGQDHTASVVDDTGPNEGVVWGFTVEYEEDPKYCAIITVEKVDTNSDPTFAEKTIILSRGYNTCNTDSPRRLERGLEIRY
jgi:hypothetical protein